MLSLVLGTSQMLVVLWLPVPVTWAPPLFPHGSQGKGGRTPGTRGGTKQGAHAEHSAGREMAPRWTSRAFKYLKRCRGVKDLDLLLLILEDKISPYCENK